MDLGFAWNDFRGGRLTTQERKLMDEWVEERKETDSDAKNIIILGSDSVREVEDLAAAVSEHQPVAVIVDSFYIMGRASGKSIYERVLGNVQELKLDIALKFEIPVLASTQLKGTTDKNVLMADSDDAMGAKAIGDYADATYGLFADPELKAANQRLLRGMEAREFVTKGIRMNFNLDTMDFSQICEVTDADLKKDKDEKKSKKRKGKKKPTKEELADDDDGVDDEDSPFFSGAPLI
jgi:hypothetical protein